MPNCQAIATEFLRQRARDGDVRTLYHARGEFWVWKANRYVPLSKVDLRHRILRWYRGENDFEFTESTWRWICENVEAVLTTESPGDPPRWLNAEGEEEKRHHWIGFENGVLDLTAASKGGVGCFRVPTPRWFSPVALPYPYDPGAKCPSWERCLNLWMDGDVERIRLLQEFVGYCLTPPNGKHAVGLFLEGEGANGKTTFCDVIEGMLGRANVSAVPLESFGERFDLYDTVGKLINFSSETDKNKKLPTQIMKSYIDSNLMTFPRRYKEGVTCHPTARLIISWNKRPPAMDDSEGFWRRILLVPWKHQFKRGERDVHIVDRLLRERAGVFNWALEGYRLVVNRGFTESKAVTDATESYRTETDSARGYLLECVEIGSGELAVDDMYTRYAEWCSRRLLEPVSSLALARRCARVFKVVSQRRRMEKGRKTVFPGLQWRT